MSISLTPQWMAALPTAGVAVLGLLSLALVGTLAALDRWQDQQLARLNALVRDDSERETAPVAVVVMVERSEGGQI